MSLLEALRHEWVLLFMVLLLFLITVALVCGERPVFDGSPVRAVHLWLTGGACDCLETILHKLFGERGIQGYDFVLHVCCERPNPIFQIFYLFIILGAFSVFYYSSWTYIPGPYLSSFHRYSGFLSVILGIAVFFKACLTDPGTLTASNVGHHLKTYPYDGTIYIESVCPTCKIPRPARSKHCGICNRCVARFDHHCVWMNTCIGANNIKYFLGFLIWHCVLCWYGVYLIVAILAGELHNHRVIKRIEYFYGTMSFCKKILHVSHWLLLFYHLHVVLMLFLAVVSIMLLVFLAYHLHLVAKNKTTNEAYKLDAYKKAYVSVMAQEQISSGDTSSHVRCCLFNCGFWNFRNRNDSFRENDVADPISMYNRGVLRNFWEVIFPSRLREISSKDD